jgi:hypothetical protein
MRDTPGDPLSAREDAPRTRRWSGVIEGVVSWADRASSDGEVGADCGDVRMIVANSSRRTRVIRQRQAHDAGLQGSGGPALPRWRGPRSLATRAHTGGSIAV